jgi:hypothetical protein
LGANPGGVYNWYLDDDRPVDVRAADMPQNINGCPLVVIWDLYGDKKRVFIYNLIETGIDQGMNSCKYIGTNVKALEQNGLGDMQRPIICRINP